MNFFFCRAREMDFIYPENSRLRKSEKKFHQRNGLTADVKLLNWKKHSFWLLSRHTVAEKEKTQEYLKCVDVLLQNL